MAGTCDIRWHGDVQPPENDAANVGVLRALGRDIRAGRIVGIATVTGKTVVRMQVGRIAKHVELHEEFSDAATAIAEMERRLAIPVPVGSP